MAGDGKRNKKIGPGIGTFSITAGGADVSGSCPGASSWCQAACYAKKSAAFRTSVRTRWDLNFAAVKAGHMPTIPEGLGAFRIHVSGDFFSVAYIRAWVRLVRLHPETKFWAYTRSWRVKRLLADLELLRAEPNVQLFASVDETIAQSPPAGWRVARIQGDEPTPGLICPEQTGAKANCAECKYCFKGTRGDVVFKQH